MLKNTSIFIFLTIIFIGDGFAQEDQPEHKRLALKTQIGESLLNELNIGVEKSITPSLSLEFNVGWIRALNLHKKCFLLGFENWKLPFVSEGGVIRFSANYYLQEKIRFPSSLTFTLIYKDVSAKDVQYDYGCFAGTNSSGYQFFSQNTKDYGAQIFINKTLINPTKRVIIDFYMGVGLRVRDIKKIYQLEGTWSDKKVSDKIENKTMVLPSVHLGIKTGLNFEKN